MQLNCNVLFFMLFFLLQMFSDQTESWGCKQEAGEIKRCFSGKYQNVFETKSARSNKLCLSLLWFFWCNKCFLILFLLGMDQLIPARMLQIIEHHLLAPDLLILLFVCDTPCPFPDGASPALLSPSPSALAPHPCSEEDFWGCYTRTIPKINVKIGIMKEWAPHGG